jgi:predicted RNA-binding Zn-ribbon protein involved in translation (DUF1610 family)
MYAATLYIQLSSSVTILYRPSSSYLNNNCRQMAIRFCSSSSVRIPGSHHAHKFQCPRSAIIACTRSCETAILFADVCWETQRFPIIASSMWLRWTSFVSVRVLRLRCLPLSLVCQKFKSQAPQWQTILICTQSFPWATYIHWWMSIGEAFSAV